MGAVRLLLLCIACAIFLLSSLVAIAGVYAIAQRKLYDAYFVVTDESLTREGFAAACLTTGLAGVLGSALGVYGAWKKKRRWLRVFIVVASLLILAEVVLGGLGFRHRDTLKSTIIDGMSKTLTQSFNQTDRQPGVSWDIVQSRQQCCGISSYKDYGNEPIPLSCGDSKKQWESRPGCRGKVQKALSRWWALWAGGDLGAAAFEIAGVILAAWQMAKDGDYSVAQADRGHSRTPSMINILFFMNESAESKSRDPPPAYSK